MPSYSGYTNSLSYDSLAEALAGVVAPDVITIIRETESNRDVAISEEIQVSNSPQLIATQPTEPPNLEQHTIDTYNAVLDQRKNMDRSIDLAGETPQNESTQIMTTIPAPDMDQSNDETRDTDAEHASSMPDVNSTRSTAARGRGKGRDRGASTRGRG